MSYFDPPNGYDSGINLLDDEKAQRAIYHINLFKTQQKEITSQLVTDLSSLFKH